MPLLLLLLILLLPAGGRAGEDRELALLQRENQLLRAEHEAARGQKIYFRFDLGEERIRIRASGVTIAELVVRESRLWGALSPGRLRTLVAKDALFPPERVRIEIPDEGKKEQKPPFAIQALELEDMPSAFRARLDDGTRLSLRPAPEGMLAGAWEHLHRIFWLLTRPLISDWNFLRGKPYTEVRLLLPAREVQLLYWALADGSACLIEAPAAGAGD